MASLVTGASGLLGRSLITALSRRGERVVALSRRRHHGDDLPGVTWAFGDLGGDIDWAPLLEGVDKVYHLAWSSLPHTANTIPAQDVAVNVVGTIRLLESLRGRVGTRFVFASSGGTVYGRPVALPIEENHPTNPISAYGHSKLAVERYLDFFGAEHGLLPLSLRISNLFGPDQSSERQFGAIATFSGRALAGQSVSIFGNGDTIRDYIFVDDAVAALLAAAGSKTRCRALNIGSGVGRSLREIVDLIGRLSGRPLAVDYLPSRPFDVKQSILDVSRAEAELGWRAVVPFEEAVAATYEGIRKQLATGP